VKKRRYPWTRAAAELLLSTGAEQNSSLVCVCVPKMADKGLLCTGRVAHGLHCWLGAFHCPTLYDLTDGGLPGTGHTESLSDPGRGPRVTPAWCRHGKGLLLLCRRRSDGLVLQGMSAAAALVSAEGQKKRERDSIWSKSRWIPSCFVVREFSGSSHLMSLAEQTCGGPADVWLH